MQYAPGEGNRPIGLLVDTNAEYLSFPKNYAGEAPILPPRTTYAAQVKYEVRHFDRRFATSIEHFLYKMFKLLSQKTSDAINMALRKKTRGDQRQITAADLLNEDTVDQLVQLDVGKKTRLDHYNSVH